MATIGVHSLRGNVQNAIDYILNKEKTEDYLCESKFCNIQYPGLEWNLKNKNTIRSRKSSKDDVVGYHFRQSFAIGSITPEKAFEISKEWIEQITGGNYDYVIATHKDTKHIHTHIIVNPVNVVTGKKMNIFFKKDVPIFKKMSDEICLLHGLETLPFTDKNVSWSYYEWMMQNKGDSQKDVIRKTIDNVIPKVKDYNEFRRYMEKLGFIVEDGSEINNNRKELRIKLLDNKYFIKTRRLQSNLNGEGYSLAEIINRIEMNGVFVSLKETTEFLSESSTIDKISSNRMDFFESNGIKLDYTSTSLHVYSKYEKMIFAKKANIAKMMNEIKNIRNLSEHIPHIQEYRERRTEVQECLDLTTKQLKSNTYTLESLIEQKLENVMVISEEELEVFSNEKVEKLKLQKNELKDELKELSKIINECENAVEEQSKTKER